MILLWLICIFACLIAGLVLYITVTSSEGAPQEAAGAAVACAIVIIPYIFARAFEKMPGPRNKAKQKEGDD
jgi:hypothetical protein